jgi:hypothetical protein
VSLVVVFFDFLSRGFGPCKSSAKVEFIAKEIIGFNTFIAFFRNPCCTKLSRTVLPKTATFSKIHIKLLKIKKKDCLSFSNCNHRTGNCKSSSI